MAAYLEEQEAYLSVRVPEQKRRKSTSLDV